MRGKWWCVMSLVMLCLTGCGVRAEKENRTEQPEPTAIVITKTSEEQELAVLKAHYEMGNNSDVALTKCCVYTSVGDDDGNGYILQMDHAGNELSRTLMKDPEHFGSLLCASDQRIIYSKIAGFDENEEEENMDLDLYSVPIVQTEDGETVLWEQEKKIAALSDREYGILDDIYLLEPYLVYSRDQDHVLVRRDMETGEEKTLDLEGCFLFIHDYTYLDGCLYPLDIDSGILYRLPVDTWIPEKLYERKSSEESIGSIWVDGQFVYMEIGRGEDDDWFSDRLECIDMEQKKTVGQLSVEDIMQFMKQEKICADDIDEWGFDYKGLSVYDGKVYLTVWVSDEELDDESNNGGKLVSLCCREKTMSDLANEQEMTDWYYEHRSFSDFFIEDDYGDFYYIGYREKEEDEDRFMRYHLDTKKLEKAAQDELICLVNRSE